MMRPYEFTMIVRPDLDEADTSAVLSRYEEKIGADGRVVARDIWGTKRFAYPVKKFFRGYYVCYNIVASPTVVKDLEHQIRFDNRVLRHIIIGIAELEETPVKDDEQTSTEPAGNDVVVEESSTEVEQQTDQPPADKDDSSPATDDTNEVVEQVSTDDDVTESATTNAEVSDTEVTEPVETDAVEVSETVTEQPETAVEVSNDETAAEPAETNDTDDERSET